MGRAGITLLDVEKASLQLQGRGKSPTVDGIREILGTGSKSTIAQHLRTWKIQQPIGQGNLPHDLLALVTGLWEKLSQTAEHWIIEAENTSKSEIHKLNHALTCVHQDFAHLKKQFHQCDESRNAERLAKEALEKQFRNAQEEQSKLQERYDSIFQHLQDHKSENARLHQLANNIQANLEHYQNSMQQLRTEQSLAIEKQQSQSQQEIVNLKLEVSLSHSQSIELERQLNNKTMEWQQLEKQHYMLQEAHSTLMDRSQKMDHELTTFKERCEQYKRMIDAHEQESVNKNSKIAEMEKQITILTEKTIQSQKYAIQTEEKIETLRHEKLFLSQEKSELQGYLKQLNQGKTT